MLAPYCKASVALKNVTVARFNSELEDSFRAGIAADLAVPEDRVVVTSVMTTARRRGLLDTAAAAAAAAGDAVAVAFKVSGGAKFHTNGRMSTTSEVQFKDGFVFKLGTAASNLRRDKR